MGDLATIIIALLAVMFLGFIVYRVTRKPSRSNTGSGYTKPRDQHPY